MISRSGKEKVRDGRDVADVVVGIVEVLMIGKARIRPRGRAAVEEEVF